MTDWPPELVEKAAGALSRVSPYDERDAALMVLNAIADDVVLKRDLSVGEDYRLFGNQVRFALQTLSRLLRR